MRTPLRLLAGPALVACAAWALGGCQQPKPPPAGDVGDTLSRELAASPAVYAPATRPSPVDALFELYVRQLASLDPNFATRLGLHEHDDRLTRYDEASWTSRRELAADALSALRVIRTEDLERDAATDRTLFMSQLLLVLHERAREDARTMRPDIPLGAIAAINDLLIRDFAPREVRVACAVARLREIPLVCGDIRARLQRPPELWTRMAIDDTNGALAFLDTVPELASGAAPGGATGGDGAAGAAASRPAGLDEALATARAALTDYRDFLQAEVLPRSDGQFAVGRTEFDYRLRVGYLLDLDADELLALGREQFAQTLTQLQDTARQIDPSRDWRAILEEMMQDHPGGPELMDVYRGELSRARQFLIDHAIVPIPDETLQLRETPPFMRSTVPFAAYDAPAPLDASRLGTFYVTPEPQAQIRSDIPGTTWHEAYPGHHLQLVYSKDNPSLVRRVNDSPLLSEGWGFYCEELASETGYYDDPRERLMQLNWRLQRAARVILDTSLHAFGMSYDDAVGFLVEQVGMRPEQAKASVNAYTQSPTYFSSYFLGMLEIVRLREACRARLGERFSLSEFHARLLRCGNVPPALIDDELEATWH